MTELEEFVEKLSEAHRDNLKSIVLYGEAVAGGQLDDEAPKKVLVIVERIAPDDLRSAFSVAEWWQRVGNPPPVYFTREEIEDASDVFPIDFLDLSEVRHVLYGEDPFVGLNISTENLRHQLEYELRGKLIRLRTLYVLATRKPEKLARLMVDSLQSYSGLFRHVLRLFGEDAPIDQREAVMKLSSHLGLDQATFERIYAYGKDEEVWLEAETNETFKKYLLQIDRVVQAVDHSN